MAMPAGQFPPMPSNPGMPDQQGPPPGDNMPMPIPAIPLKKRSSVKRVARGRHKVRSGGKRRGRKR